MFLKHGEKGELIEVLHPEVLYDPFVLEVEGKSHQGEEMQEPEFYRKDELRFPSGELLPKCWLHPDYRLASVHP